MDEHKKSSIAFWIVGAVILFCTIMGIKDTMFAQISEQAWNAIITALAGVVVAGVQVVIGQRNKRAIDESSKRADDHAVTAAVGLKENTEVTEATHVLVNSSYAVQLQSIAVLSRRLAVITKDPKDVEAAEVAERLYAEHVDKQSIMDQKESVNVR